MVSALSASFSLQFLLSCKQPSHLSSEKINLRTENPSTKAESQLYASVSAASSSAASYAALVLNKVSQKKPERRKDSSKSSKHRSLDSVDQNEFKHKYSNIIIASSLSNFHLVFQVSSSPWVILYSVNLRLRHLPLTVSSTYIA